ncbi:MAG: LPS assembly lipoprotein LptE [Woeseiaceae bacterium]|nr:LPS assembly lipoprotein LptE [Woeseiaceae bacterium]
MKSRRLSRRHVLAVGAGFAGTLVFGGCGFQLRGRAQLPAEMSRTFLASNDRQSLFHRKLRRALIDNGIQIVDSPVDATAVLRILDDETGQRVLSVSARNIPREYEVFYRIRFSVEAGETTLIEPQEQALVRDYTYDETQVLGKAREEELLRDAIADDLVRVVMFQLAAI